MEDLARGLERRELEVHQARHLTPATCPGREDSTRLRVPAVGSVSKAGPGTRPMSDKSQFPVSPPILSSGNPPFQTLGEQVIFTVRILNPLWAIYPANYLLMGIAISRGRTMDGFELILELSEV